MDLVAPHSRHGLEWPLSSGFPGGTRDTLGYSWSDRKRGGHTHPSDLPNWSRTNPTDARHRLAALLVKLGDYAPN